MKYIIGVTAYNYDSSACLFKDNELVFACEEEKFTGIKHDTSFPINVINYIFNEFNLTKDDIDVICYYENLDFKNDRIIENLKKNLHKAPFYSLEKYISLLGNRASLEKKLLNYSDNIYFSEHHKSHLYYSFYTSPFDDSVVLSIDSAGEKDTITFGFGSKYGVTYASLGIYPNSIGLFYSAMSSYLGYPPIDGEYKLMDLASYGNYSYYIDKVRELIYFDEKLYINMKYFVWDKSKTIMFNEKLYDLLQIMPRLPEEKITDEHKNLAASVQQVYEEILFKILNYISTKYTSSRSNLCLAGSVAYNTKANGKIVNNSVFEHIWTPSAPSDAGSSIGACITYLVEREFLRKKINTTPFLGPKFHEIDIIDAIGNFPYIKYEDRNQLNTYIASELSKGNIIGWYYGKIEFGLRALGGRSILADPRLTETKDRINKLVKKRENFRPFGSMVIKEKQNKFFDIIDDLPYMSQTVKVKKEYIDKLNAVINIDGTSRPQTIYQDNIIYDLLLEFEKLTGFPILLNTSFNINNKTIILEPKDAVNTFLNTDIDILVLDNYVLKKSIL